jgi:hypothetical protein
MFIIPALGRPRQEYKEFKANLGYTARVCLQKTPLFCKSCIKKMKEVQYLNIVKNNKPEASVSQTLTHNMEIVIQPE